MTLHRTDVAIIGGGIIGLATAYELQRRNVRVTVLESDAVGAAQSGRNWGFVRQQGRSRHELPMMRAANLRWQQLETETGERFGWVRAGNLALADGGSADRYARWADLGRQHGLDTRLVTADEVRGLVPGLRIPHSAALYTSSDGQADPLAATRALARAAERGGVVVLEGHAVRGIERRRGQVTGVSTCRGFVHADVVVCAAGAASRRLLRTAGVRLPQNFVRGTVAMTEPVPPLTATTVWAPGLAFRQREDGRIVVSTGGGGDIDITLDTLLQAAMFLPAFRHNYRKMRLRLNGAFVRDLQRRLTGRGRDSEPRPSRTLARRSLLRLREAVPALAQARLESAWAGIIDATPDGLPVIDRLTEPAGLVVASGFSGHGFGLAPAAGRIIAGLVNDETSDIDLDPFRLRRFETGDFVAPDAIL